MIKLQWDAHVVEKHKAYVVCKVKANIRRHQEKQKKSLLQYPQFYLELMTALLESGRLETIAVGSMENCEKQLNNIKGECSWPQELEVRDIKFILSLFSYDAFSDAEYKPESEVAKDWSAYELMLSGNIRVCSFCNRQYITPFYVQKNRGDNPQIFKMRGQFDHFYPKSKYPLFALSLYNLVPCCAFCNTAKLEKTLLIKDNGKTLTPYNTSFANYFRFRLKEIDSPVIEIEHLSDNIEEYTSMFRLEEQYNFHANLAEELRKKRSLYPDSQLEELFVQNKPLFHSVDEVRELVIGIMLNKERFNEEALSKFRRDIAVQLGFLDDFPKLVLSEYKGRLEKAVKKLG